MMRLLRRCAAVSLALTAGLTGCLRSTHSVPLTHAPASFQTATVEEIEKQVSARDNALLTLNAQVMITASTGGEKEGKETEYTSLRGYIFVRKPRDLRVLMQAPLLGSRVLDMVSDATNFTLLMHPLTSPPRAIIGTNTVTKPSKNGLENLRPQVFFDSLLVPGVNDDEAVTLTETTRVIESEKHKNDVEEPVYDLTVLRRKSAKVFERQRIIRISRVNMLPIQQDVYDKEGQIVTTTTYEQYKAFGDQQFPTLITINRPIDEYKLKLEVTKLTLNGKLEDDQFELKIPPGIAVQKME